MRSPDENDTDDYGLKERVRRVSSMYALNTRYLRWCSTFLRINTIYASVYQQVERYIGGDCADVAVIAYQKMGGSLSTYPDWWADALAKANDPELSTVNEPRAGDLVLFDIDGNGTFDHTTIFAGNMDISGDRGDRLTPDDRVIVTNFGHTGSPVPPSEWGAYAVVWGTYDMFPYLFEPDPNNPGEVRPAIPIKVRHLSQVTEHMHP